MYKQRRPPVPLMISFIVGFAIPTIILFYFSEPSRLGPLVAMLIALVLPIGLEVYSLATGRKISYLSIAAIVGILLIGAISLLGLSEQWLAVRRAGIYALGALAVAGALWFRPGLADKGLSYLVDMQAIRTAATRRKSIRELNRHILRVGWALVVVLAALAIWNYALTLIVINAPTGSSEFNTQYAALRVMSIPYVSVPFFVAVSALVLYLVLGIERLTGLDTEALLKKK